MTPFAPILAEIGDKEPTLAAMWCVAGVLCVASLLLSRWRKFAGLVVVPMAILWTSALLAETRDPYVGPAILEELGRGYVAQAYISGLLPFVAVAIAFGRKHAAA